MWRAGLTESTRVDAASVPKGLESGEERTMNGFVFPSMEDLESRRLLSATFATSGLCLIPPPTHTPTPTPAPPAIGRHHHHHHRIRVAAPSPSPVGDWAADSVDASLQVSVSQ